MEGRRGQAGAGGEGWALVGLRADHAARTRQGSEGNGDLGGAQRARQVVNWARPSAGVQGQELRTLLPTHLGSPWKRVVSTFVMLNVLTPTLTKGNEWVTAQSNISGTLCATQEIQVFNIVNNV